ncbi:MAG: peptidoglycan-binding protein [Chloroflexi bacterium]|nr:peptidoglycan-binding protein [Chloroflexota bacterium]
MTRRSRVRMRRSHQHDEHLQRIPQLDTVLQQPPQLQTMTPESVYQLPRQQQQAVVRSMAGHYGNRQIQRYVNQIQRAAGSTLRMGSRSPEVQTLQQQLNNAGANLVVDGIFGPQTRQAVIQFQRAAGLAPDGVVGPQTWASLSSGGVKIPPSPGMMGQLVAAKLQQINTLVKNRKQQSAQLKQTTFNEPSVAEEEHDHAGHDWAHDDDEESWWDTASDWVDEKVDSASDWVSEKTEDATSWVEEQYDSASDWVEDTWDSVTDTAGDVWDSVSDTAGDVWDSVTDTASEAWDVVKDTASEIVNDVKDITEEIGDWVNEGLDKLIDIASGIFSDDTLSFLDEIIKSLTGESDDEKEDVAKEGTASPFSLAALGGAIGCDIPVRFEPEIVSSVESGPVEKPLSNDVTKPGNLYIGPSTAQGITVPGGAFGYAEPKFGADSITWKFAGGYITIGARVTVDCRYDINSLGKADITDPESDKVTENNWDTILWDLKPDDDGRPPRNIFWSSPITQSHELYHCQEYINQAGSSLDSRKSMLNGHNIEEPWFWESEDDAAEIRASIQALLKKMVGSMQQDVFDHYKSGGEARAYGAGKGAYDGLLKGIRDRAKREGWDKSDKDTKP